MSKSRKCIRRLFARRLTRASCSSALLLVAVACGSNSAVNPLLQTPALPGDPATAISNSYLGTQSPGLWFLTLGQSQSTFSYQPLGATTAPVAGNFAVQNGIENFGANASGVSDGMAVELTGRSAILRPGDNTTAPVAVVDSSGCFPVSGRVRFIYTGLQTSTSTGHYNSFPAAYGTLVISTSTDGSSWQIGDQRQYALPTLGSQNVTPGTLTPSNAPLEYSAACTKDHGQTVLTAAANPVFTALPNFAFNSAGYFIEDFPGSQAPASAGYVGLIMPSAPLSGSDIVSYSYRGLVYEPGAPGVPATQPMRLDPNGKTLLGGVFPNDDPTAVAGTNFTISLGSQDSALYGVFPKAKLIVSDPGNNCAKVNSNTSAAQPGFDVNGIPTCTTQGVAVVGKPEGKYVIYFTSLDGTVNSPGDNAYTLQMYLYQQ